MRMKSKAEVRILLIQIRRDPSMVLIERQSFTSLSDLKEDQWTTLDVYRVPHFKPTILDQYDAFMIGGLSDDPSDTIEYPSHFTPWIENLHQLMKYAIEVKKPGMLSCGGFMLASRMLGAEIVTDEKQRELGFYTLTLTPSAKSDLLFKNFPAKFSAVSGHIKSTNSLPNNCLLLVSSERCRIHGFKVKEAPFYAFQFHPEMKAQELKARVELYKDKYFRSQEDFIKFISLDSDTTVANSMVSRFIQMVMEMQSK